MISGDKVVSETKGSNFALNTPTHRGRRQMFGHQVGKEGAGTNGEIGIQVYTLLIESVSDARDAGNVDLIPGSGRSPWRRA